MKAITLFSGIGVDEFNLKNLGIDVVLGNELMENRSKVHSYLFPQTEMITGDINSVSIQQKIIDKSKKYGIDLIIATPPCQGVSTIGKNKKTADMLIDPRNHLIISALNIIDEILPSYILIENVPRYQSMKFPYKNELHSLEDILKHKYGDKYNVEIDILDVADYGVPQYRKRIIYRIWKKGLTWNLPEKEEHITLYDAIGDLPSLESGEVSEIKNHWSRLHPENQIIAMKNTPTGKTALDNEEFYPRRKDGNKVKAYNNTYKRMRWDYPAPTVTMRNEIISSQENVHPGRKNGDVWSDARVLTLRELFIISSLPADLTPPDFISDTAFRQFIGEGVPPLFMEKILGGLSK